MKLAATLLALVITAACAVRYSTVVPIREQQFRSHDQPAALPLLAAAMRRAEIPRDEWAKAVQEACQTIMDQPRP